MKLALVIACALIAAPAFAQTWEPKFTLPDPADLANATIIPGQVLTPRSYKDKRIRTPPDVTHQCLARVRDPDSGAIACVAHNTPEESGPYEAARRAAKKGDCIARVTTPSGKTICTETATK
jgi:hypothetical protein